MKDLTRQFFEQSPDYGRRAKENITRVGNYVNKAKNILTIIGRKDVKVQVFFGRVLTRQFQLERKKIPGLVRTYGNLYFMELFYNQMKDTLIIRLNELAPKKEIDKSEQRFYWKN